LTFIDNSNITRLNSSTNIPINVAERYSAAYVSVLFIYIIILLYYFIGDRILYRRYIIPGRLCDRLVVDGCKAGVEIPASMASEDYSLKVGQLIVSSEFTVIRYGRLSQLLSLLGRIACIA